MGFLRKRKVTKKAGGGRKINNSKPKKVGREEGGA